MENTQGLTPAESLDIITQAIQQTKENFKEQSFYYLLWGWLVVIAAIGNYGLLMAENYTYAHLPWILMPIGAVVTVVFAIKEGKQQGRETYFDVFLKYLWMVLGVAFFLVVGLSFSLQISPTILTLFLAGIGTTVSGLVMKFKPLIFGGIAFFIFSIWSAFLTGPLVLLINALAITIGYLIPAYLLKKS